MTIQNIYNIGWMASLGLENLMLFSFLGDPLDVEDDTGEYLTESGAFMIDESATVSEGTLLQSNGDTLLI